MTILIENLSKNFGKYKALDRVNLEIKIGSLVALVGPSGSGKSTLLRIIAGLEIPDEGRIWLVGRDATSLSVQEREIGFVFQNYALFPHMTVYNNIAFGLDVRKMTANTIKNRVNQLLQLIQLDKFANRYPSQLSGGQRQRVALARALAIEPKVLLLDEPFGALDLKVKKELRNWLRRLHDQVPVTTIFVTHDHQEAMEVANEIVVFKEGRVDQIGNPQDFHKQLSMFSQGNLVEQSSALVSPIALTKTRWNFTRTRISNLVSRATLDNFVSIARCPPKLCLGTSFKQLHF